MTPSERIDRLIAELTDWRGRTLAGIRKTILEDERKRRVVERGSPRTRAEDERDNAVIRRLLRGICVGVAFLGAFGALPAQAGGRVLTTMDVVSIRVLSQPDLNTTTRVEPDGTINFPYVGRIKAAGLTQDQLERAIERRLVELQILADP
jgi:protein involved in polysaccharide export with SLBB domain